MPVSPELLANVKQAEGLRTVAYRDTNGFWTIGYGHKLAANRDWSGYAINTDYASALLTVDLNQAAMAALSLPEWPKLDTPARQDAIVEILFNMGAGTWLKFLNTRAAIEAQNWPSACNNLLNSLWARQVHETRANRIANQLLDGYYVT